MPPVDFLFRGSIEELDPAVAELIRHETARQAQYLIMIPSESTIPNAVREAVGSSFSNLYAEGYPTEAMRWMTEDEILNYNERLQEYRRDSDSRYYKGAEYANLLESLARRRVAEAFAANGLTADDLYVNVQPLSGAPANSAAYTALVNVGETVMGLDLLDGGHLTHGSPVNRSGIYYNIVSYGVDPQTERLDYDVIRGLAIKHQPKMIIAGFTSYPFAPDWAKFRAIADEVGAYLLADIAHTAGMAIAGAYPNPVGIADVVNFTTHKTLHGPRGAVSITHRKDLYKKIDRAVFPGEQGGPHVNSIAGLAVAMSLTRTDQFHQLQHQIAKNAIILAEAIAQRGIRIAYGGTNTHMLLIDCKGIRGDDGAYLSGDIAARLLDLCGIVANRNTIPGDRSAFSASGVRLGTTWITQRGFFEEHCRELGNVIADVFYACTPYYLREESAKELRAKVDFDILQQARNRVRDLVARIGIDTDVRADGYPHYFYMEQEQADGTWSTLEIAGKHAEDFLDVVLSGRVLGIAENTLEPSYVLEPDGQVMSRVLLQREGNRYQLHIEQNAQRVTAWLRSLSDGFVRFDADLLAKVPGAVDVRRVEGGFDGNTSDWTAESGYTNKPYFIGCKGAYCQAPQTPALPVFEWAIPAETTTLLTTPIHALHQSMGAKMVPFAGYDMPVYYSSVTNEHNAVRKKAGVFDVTHMGVFDVQGEASSVFINLVFSNDVTKLAVGESQYGFLLDVNAQPFDDLMVYRLGIQHFLIVVNASNNDKDWAWLNAVKDGQVQVNAHMPSRTFIYGDAVQLRDLRAESSGADRRVDIALQGRNSLKVLTSLANKGDKVSVVRGLEWAGVAQVTLGKFDLIVSRTGYTGERQGYELFVHPDQATALFQALLENGAEPCGLASRDSLRTEAGLPLYGHELAGDLQLGASDAGMGKFVKLWKPFFVGRDAYKTYEATRDSVITRFKINLKGARPPKAGDPVVDGRGRVIGIVTSCTIDSDGYQNGLVYIKETHATEDTEIQIFAGGLGNPTTETPRIGSKVTVPQSAVILSRYPKQKK